MNTPKVYTISYKLYSSNVEETEELVEETSKEHPFVFLTHNNQVLEDFESKMLSLKESEKFDFKIECNNAYGSYEDDKVVELPLNVFQEEDGKVDYELLSVGNELPMVDADGNRAMGIVLELKKDLVVMDFNHPLSDYDLRFVGMVNEIREATAEEVAHGHVHGPHGHEH
jgi:FKBP-type peptidyl-prolyl cis-trans isomerase SlyD